MDFQQLIFSRRSVRKFTDRKPEAEIIGKLLDMTFTAPSSKNMRTTRIAVTDDRQILETISLMRSSGSGFVKDVPLAFLVMGDDSQTDLWRENCAISATILQLAAESFGLASCWVQVHGRPNNESEPDAMSAESFLRENISGLPAYRIMCVIAVGYPEEPARPRTVKDNSDKIFYL